MGWSYMAGPPGLDGRNMDPHSLNDDGVDQSYQTLYLARLYELPEVENPHVDLKGAGTTHEEMYVSGL